MLLALVRLRPGAYRHAIFLKKGLNGGASCLGCLGKNEMFAVTYQHEGFTIIVRDLFYTMVGGFMG
jgi:hypothetical protein